MIRIAPLRNEDIPALGEMVGAYARSQAQSALGVHPRGLLEAALSPESVCLLAWEEDMVVGYGVALPTGAGGGNPAWLIDQLYAARPGAGPPLLKALEAAGAAAGHHHVIADIARPGMDRAMRFYGYRAVSVCYAKEL